jgi:hypothetical protein
MSASDYTIKVMKVLNKKDAWWLFVQLPEKHVCTGASVEFFSQLPAGVPAPPVPITQRRGGGCPMDVSLFGLIHDGSQTEAQMIADALADYFKKLAADHVDALRAAPKHFCEGCDCVFRYPMERVAGYFCCADCAPEYEELDYETS